MQASWQDSAERLTYLSLSLSLSSPLLFALPPFTFGVKRISRLQVERAGAKESKQDREHLTYLSLLSPPLLLCHIFPLGVKLVSR